MDTDDKSIRIIKSKIYITFFYSDGSHIRNLRRPKQLRITFEISKTAKNRGYVERAIISKTDALSAIENATQNRMQFLNWVPVSRFLQNFVFLFLDDQFLHGISLNFFFLFSVYFLRGPAHNWKGVIITKIYDYGCTCKIVYVTFTH